MTEAFSQLFCSVAPCGAGGRIITSRRLRDCHVQVADGELTLVQPPARPIVRTSASMVRIVTPPTLRKVGTALVLQIDDDLLAVEFDVVYRRQRSHAENAAKRRFPAAGALREIFSISAITSIKKAMRLGRELARECTAALLAAGAVDMANPTGSPSQ